MAEPKTFFPIECMSHTAVSADATADYYIFTLPRTVTNCIAQIQAATTGVVNSAGLAVILQTNATTSKQEVKVAATSITAGDVINIICW